MRYLISYSDLRGFLTKCLKLLLKDLRLSTQMLQVLGQEWWAFWRFWVDNYQYTWMILALS